MLMCVFLFLLWLIFNGRVTLEICLFGIVVTGLYMPSASPCWGIIPGTSGGYCGRLGRYLQYARRWYGRS